MSGLSPRIPVAIYLYRDYPPFGADEAAHGKPTLVITPRRSVTSMRRLLPLSLPTSHPNPLNPNLSNGAIDDQMESPSRSRTPTPEPVGSEAMAGQLDQCLPEMLARDLEMSSSVFEAKNMTAGLPASALVFEDDDDDDLPTVFGPERTHNSPYWTASPRVNRLGAIEERSSMVSFLERRHLATEPTPSDPESDSDHDSFAGVEAPSVKVREQSIMTAATSLHSGCCGATSPKNAQSTVLSCNRSWIDPDSEDEGDVDESTNFPQPIALSPRPPTPPTSEPARSIVAGSWCQSPTRQKCHSLTESGSLGTRGPMPMLEVPPRRTSLVHAQTYKADSVETTVRSHSPCQDEPTTVKKRRKTLQSSSPPKTLDVTTESRRAETTCQTPSIDDLEEDSIFGREPAPEPRPTTAYLQATPPPSPLPTVQAWLDKSNPPCAPQLPVDDLAKALPLPPDVIETLRVSIACFPETMLLSSSLTIETIRTYSKKVRQPPADFWDSLDDSVSSQSPRKSLWKKVVSGRGSRSGRLSRMTPSPEDAQRPETSATELTSPPPPWMQLRHIFSRTCSDDVCDALYAHIIAYNYISRVPRSPPSTATNRSSTTESQKTAKEHIPKKAVSLLGIANSPTPTSASTGRPARKAPSPFGAWGFSEEDDDEEEEEEEEDELTPPATTSGTAPGSSPETQTMSAQDGVTQSIEAGLLRCITRLVGTARTGGRDWTIGGFVVEAGNNGLVDGDDAPDVDMMFVRSLCEIVRMSEETCQV